MDEDTVLGLDSLDFMKDNGGEFFLTTEDRATYAEADELSFPIKQLKEVNPNLGGFTFEELEIDVFEQFDDEVKMLIAEYEKELEVWKEAQNVDKKEWIKNKKRRFTP